MAEDRSAAEVARDLADALEQGGIPYAIGGAIALGFYAAPRAKADVEAVLRDQGPAFDREWVRRKLAELAGEGDERLRAWDELVRDVDRP